MLDIDLLRKDECQPYTDEQVTNIKSQFHPSNTANVNIVPYHIYDEDEHVVGEWREVIDGVKKKKPVYEKRVDYGTLPNSADKSVAHGISNLEKVVSIINTVNSTSGDYANGDGFWSLSNINANVLIYATKTNIIASTKSDRTNTSLVVNLRYTKTTDQWQTS